MYTDAANMFAAREIMKEGMGVAVFGLAAVLHTAQLYLIMYPRALFSEPEGHPGPPLVRGAAMVSPAHCPLTV